MICASRRPPPPPPRWEWVVAGSGLSVVHAPSGRDPHADEEAPRCGAHPGTTPGQPSAPPAAAADRACQQQCEALSHCERPDPAVEGGRPRSRDGTLLRPAQFPGTSEPVAAHVLIGINSTVFRGSGPRRRSHGYTALRPGWWPALTRWEARPDAAPGNADTTSGPAGSAACGGSFGGWYGADRGGAARCPWTSP